MSASAICVVDREVYDRTIEVLGKAVNRASMDRSEKVRAFRRLAGFGETASS